MRGIGALVGELHAALVLFDPAEIAGDECAALAEGLARLANACAAASVRAAARAVECGVVRGGPDASPGEWLARVGGSTAGAARASLETVNRLDACPATRDAVLTGDVSLAQAAQIVSLPEHEEELLAMARRSGLRAVRNTARQRRVDAIPPDELAARQRAARRFVHWKDELGMIRFRGALPPLDGVPFINRLDTQTDREWRAAKRLDAVESREAHAADAFLHLLETGTTVRTTRADVVFVIDHRAYTRGHAHPGEPCHLLGGGPVPVSAVREQVPTAFVKAVLHDGTHIQQVVHYGRRRSAELNTALELGRPPQFLGVSCAEAGCDRIYGLQWDHKNPRANRGPTTLTNLQPLCTPHHWNKTQRDAQAGLHNNHPRPP